MEREVTDSDAFTAEREVAQLLVSGIGVAALGGRIGGEEGER
jgi:hypothetical protein